MWLLRCPSSPESCATVCCRLTAHRCTKHGYGAAECGRAPQSVAELFPGLSTAVIPIGEGLAESLVDASAAGRIAICDTETDDDLDAIVGVGLTIRGAQFVGTAALAAAVARMLPPCPRAAARPVPRRQVLTVVGTAEPTAAQQVTALLTAGVRHVNVDVSALLGGSADHAPVRRALEFGSAVVTIGGVNAGRFSDDLGCVGSFHRYR